MKEFPNIKVTKIKIGSDACYNKDVADSTFSNLSVCFCVLCSTLHLHITTGRAEVIFWDLKCRFRTKTNF